MILLDTSGLLAAMFKDQNQHEACARALREAEPPRVMSPFVLAEVARVISHYSRTEALVALLEQIHARVYEVAHFTADDCLQARSLIASHSSLSLPSASIVVLANRFATRDVLTLNEQRFRVVRPSQGRFRLLPADAPSPSGRRKTAATKSLRP